MTMQPLMVIDQMIERYPTLETCKQSIEEACNTLFNSYQSGGTLLICGNGGSGADADHIVGELMKSFERPRPLNKALADKIKACDSARGSYLAENLQGTIPAISLHAHSALVSAISNDIDGDLVFAQQLAGYGKQGDTLLAISTSGKSRNVIDAAIVARSMGIKVIALTGSNKSRLRELSDVAVCVPANETYAVQEYHLPVYRTFCRFLELALFG